jgi:hypothetical protein
MLLACQGDAGYRPTSGQFSQHPQGQGTKAVGILFGPAGERGLDGSVVPALREALDRALLCVQEHARHGRGSNVQTNEALSQLHDLHRDLGTASKPGVIGQEQIARMDNGCG